MPHHDENMFGYCFLLGAMAVARLDVGSGWEDIIPGSEDIQILLKIAMGD